MAARHRSRVLTESGRVSSFATARNPDVELRAATSGTNASLLLVLLVPVLMRLRR